MSESFDEALKTWCSQAHALVGQPLVSSGGSVKDKWSELDKLVTGNIDGKLLTTEIWEKQRKLIEDAISKRELDPSDLSLDGDPIKKAIALGTKIVDGREIVARAEKIGVKRAGLKVLVSSKTGKAEITELEKIDALWKETEKTVRDYVEMVGLAQDSVYQTALEKAPTAETFQSFLQSADVAGARSTAEDYASWWPQTKSALAKVRKLKGDYGDGSQHIDPQTWYDLAVISDNIDRLGKEIAEELKKANNAIGSGKSKTAKSSVEHAERALKRVLDAWNKVGVSPPLENKEDAGKTALDELTELLIEAQELAVVEPSFTTNPLYQTLTTHIEDRYKLFASQSNQWDRLSKRGVDCVPAVSDFLRENFRLGMGIRVGGRVYTVSPSNTSSAGLAFHTPIPSKLLIPARPNVQSFVYHF